MRAGRLASCWDRYVVSVTFGCVGNRHVKRSSRLANSTHSWAKIGTATESATAVEISGVRRILFLLWRGLTAGGSASFCPALVAVDFVTVRARVVEFLTDPDEGFIVPGLGCCVRELSYFYESSYVLLPVRAIDGNQSAVLAEASRCQKQRCRFGYSHCSLVDRQPSCIDR